MSEAIYDVVGGHVEAVSLAHRNSQQPETVLLCRNSLVSIGLKYLLEGTCFSITNSASDAAFFSLSCPDALPGLFIMDGSDTPGHIIDTAKALKGQYPQARIAVIADCFDLGFV